MAFQVVHANEWQFQGLRRGLCKNGANHERAREAGAQGGRDTIKAIPRDAGPFKRQPNEPWQKPDMSPGRELWHNPAKGLVFILGSRCL